MAKKITFTVTVHGKENEAPVAAIVAALGSTLVGSYPTFSATFDVTEKLGATSILTALNEKFGDMASASQGPDASAEEEAVPPSAEEVPESEPSNTSTKTKRIPSMKEVTVRLIRLHPTFADEIRDILERAFHGGAMLGADGTITAQIPEQWNEYAFKFMVRALFSHLDLEYAAATTFKF